MQNKNRKYLLLIFAGLVVANIFVLSEIARVNNRVPLAVDFFDVGQGDSIFIETAFGHQILIDGGPSPVVVEKLAKEMPFWDRTIDLVILTHSDKDHITGLLEVLKRYEVENILWTGAIKNSPEDNQWASLIKKSKSKIEIAKAGEKIIIQEKPYTYIDILSPEKDISGEVFGDLNDTSIVSLLNFENNKFLFTGDISEKKETELLASGNDIKSNVLKVGHHGSKTSTSDNFLKIVLPETAIISVGKDNNYGHPSSEVLERLNKFGIDVLRTDQIGDIKVVSDGINIKTLNN